MSSNTEQSCCFKCPRNVINAPFNTEHNLFLMSYKSPQTSFPSVEAQTVVFHRKSPIFPQFFMVRMQSLCQQKESMCTFWQFKFDIFWINGKSYCAYVSGFEIHKSDTFHCLKQVLLQAEYLPSHTRIMPLGGQAAQMKLSKICLIWSFSKTQL